MKRSIMWFRRDLRISDHPALLAALAESEEIIPLFILDEKLYAHAATKRLAYLAQSLRELNRTLDDRLHVIAGSPIEVLNSVKKAYGAGDVHISEEFEPYGRARDEAVEAAGIALIRTGSPYAVSPGRVRKPDGTNYRVYTPFYKAWVTHGWRAPVAAPKIINAVEPGKSHQNFPHWALPEGAQISPAGEDAAQLRFRQFQESALMQYNEMRNVPGVEGTSRLSAHLKFGEIHPRTLLAPLGNSDGEVTFRKEIAWREFYADVLTHYPHTDNDYYSPQYAEMRYDEPGEKLEAWKRGQTGYPFVDAAMRQLVHEGWMHNRARMVVASFLVKDLHIEWQHGANFFQEHLIDFDVASNAHGWQWTAGCGTDASPYYRVFNPIEQGRRFDPEGIYIRRFLPEVAHLDNDAIHEPWKFIGGLDHRYPAPIVDHAVERVESLARLQELKDQKPNS